MQIGAIFLLYMCKHAIRSFHELALAGFPCDVASQYRQTSFPLLGLRGLPLMFATCSLKWPSPEADTALLKLSCVSGSGGENWVCTSAGCTAQV